jgi:ABC-type dipeptide/oligopeptide/nickel transport system permease component
MEYIEERDVNLHLVVGVVGFATILSYTHPLNNQIKRLRVAVDLFTSVALFCYSSPSYSYLLFLLLLLQLQLQLFHPIPVRICSR